MKTAQDVILDFQALPVDQQEEVIHYVASHQQQEIFSDEDTALILQAKEDAKQGINMSGPFKGKEAIDFLTDLENQESL
jgi:hypothetical protein